MMFLVATTDTPLSATPWERESGHFVHLSKNIASPVVCIGTSSSYWTPQPAWSNQPIDFEHSPSSWKKCFQMSFLVTGHWHQERICTSVFIQVPLGTQKILLSGFFPSRGGGAQWAKSGGEAFLLQFSDFTKDPMHDFNRLFCWNSSDWGFDHILCTI